MAYTNVWNTTNPVGSDPASNADDDIRKLRLDIQERMDTVLGTGNWTVDPVVSWTGANTLFLSWGAFSIITGGATWTNAAGSNYGLTTATPGTYQLYAHVPVPRGVVITGISVVGRTSASATIVGTLESVDATTSVPVQATLATVTLPVGTDQTVIDSSVLAVTVNSTSTNYLFYYLHIAMGAGTYFHGVRITYTRSSIVQAI